MSDPLEVDVDAIAQGLMHAMVMAGIETRFEDVVEYPMPTPGSCIEVFPGSKSKHKDFGFSLTITNYGLQKTDENFVIYERRTPRNLTAQQRYEVLERLAEFVMDEAAKARKEASE